MWPDRTPHRDPGARPLRCLGVFLELRAPRVDALLQQEQAAKRMIAALEWSMIPWQVHDDPRSMSTGMPDRGMNVFLLALTAAQVVLLGLAEQDLNSALWTSSGLAGVS
jgi:hypothetical protein